MLAHLMLISALSAQAATPNPALPLRPTTYPVDTRFSSGRAEGFLDFSVDPATFADQLKPVAKRKHVKKLPPPRVLLKRDRIEINDRIYFETDKAVIKPESFGLLDEIAKILVDHPEVTRLSIEGHTDAQGSDRHNQKLSEARAKAVRDYVAGKGVDASRLEFHGYGESRPVADNATEEGRAANRRVEFVVKGWDTARAPEAPPAPPTVIEEPETGKGDLPIVNTGSSWGVVSLNGREVGRVAPLTNAVVHDVPAGFYDVAIRFQNGFEEKQRVHTVQVDGPLVPGGEDARAALDDPDIVPTWHDHPEWGYNPPASPAQAE